MEPVAPPENPIPPSAESLSLLLTAPRAGAEDATPCTGDGCAVPCAGDGCAVPCAGDGCAGPCAGEVCVALCVGEGCAVLRVGEGCAGLCVAEGCAVPCVGEGCVAPCVGEGCAAPCVGDGCAVPCAGVGCAGAGCVAPCAGEDCVAPRAGEGCAVACVGEGCAESWVGDGCSAWSPGRAQLRAGPSACGLWLSGNGLRRGGGAGVDSVDWGPIGEAVGEGDWAAGDPAVSSHCGTASSERGRLGAVPPDAESTAGLSAAGGVASGRTSGAGGSGNGGRVPRSGGGGRSGRPAASVSEPEKPCGAGGIGGCHAASAAEEPDSGRNGLACASGAVDACGPPPTCRDGTSGDAGDCGTDCHEGWELGSDCHGCAASPWGGFAKPPLGRNDSGERYCGSCCGAPASGIGGRPHSAGGSWVSDLSLRQPSRRFLPPSGSALSSDLRLARFFSGSGSGMSSSCGRFCTGAS